MRVTLRWRSLWRRRVEFSRITLDRPSVNLVHLPDGRWNLESILLQASRMPAAPTAQQGAGDAPRFPYIEATGARVNIKLGAEKMPISLTDAEFSLWLPEPQQWKLRLEAHPSRTDTAAADTGILRVEGTLGKAGTLEGVPVDLYADWPSLRWARSAPCVSGADAGFRGEMNLHASVLGTLGENTLETRLQLTGVHRADFVPAQTLDVGLACKAQASDLFHQLRGIRCAWPANAARRMHAPGRWSPRRSRSPGNSPRSQDPLRPPSTEPRPCPPTACSQRSASLSQRVPAQLAAAGRFPAAIQLLLHPGSSLALFHGAARPAQRPALPHRRRSGRPNLTPAS